MIDDLRCVVRGWKARPAFFATVVLTLTLSVGLAGAVFAFADGYLFRSLPFPSADRLFYVRDPAARIASALLASETQALRRSSLADLGFVEWSPAGRVDGELFIGDRRVDVFAYEVSEGFRSTLGLRLHAGRDFAPAEHRDGGVIPAWLSHRFWVRELGGDLAALGRTVRIERPSGDVVDVRVVGILGRGVSSFDLNNRPPDLVVPAPPPEGLGPNVLSFPIVRLPEGMSRAQGARQIAQVLQVLAPALDGGSRVVRLDSLWRAQVAGGRPTALVLFIGGMLVVLLAAANLVHLLLVRGVSRSGEIATRAALGATRWRVARLFLIEALSAGGIGIPLGLLVAGWLARVIDARVPAVPTGGRNLSLVPMLFDWRVVAFAACLGLVVALVAGAWPAWRAMRQPVRWVNRSHAGTAAAMPARASRAILACELGLATVVMMGAVFIGMGIWRYLDQPLAFDYEQRFSIDVRPAGSMNIEPHEVAGAIRAIRDLPGVVSAGNYDAPSLPEVEVDGRVLDEDRAAGYGAAAGYFEAWNLRILEGRGFAEADYRTGAPVVIVDDRFAASIWPGADPLGRTVRVGGGPMREVIGVVAAPRWRLSSTGQPAVYVPLETPPATGWLVAWIPSGRMPAVGERLAGAVQAAVPGMRVTTRPVTRESLFAREAGEAWFQAPFMVVFGVFALLLAAIGVFGVVSYVVERRMKEFGIRLALGARPMDVWCAVTLQSVSPALAGLAEGTLAALALERVVTASVFGWQSSSVLALSLVAATLVAVTVAAAALPARRAMRTDPVATLRAE
jgi:predicted permease